MKNINYKLINYTLISIIIFLIILSGDFWLWGLTKISVIIIPFLVAFAIAYALYPTTKWLESKNIPKWAAITIVTVLLLGSIILIISMLIPLVYEQTLQLVTNAIEYITNLKNNVRPESMNLIDSILTKFTNFNSLIGGISNTIATSAFDIIGIIIEFFSNAIIIFFSFIYFLIDMDRIRKSVKEFFKRKKKTTYEYVKNLDEGIRKYIVATFKFIGVQIIEYSIIFFLIGHPYFLILAILAAITSVIPIFGGFIIAVIALITALVVSPTLFVSTLVVVLILSSIDGYFWSPKIYGKANDVHPLIIIFGVFTGGILLGFWGMVLSLPVTIIISISIKYYKDKINFKKIKLQ